MIYQRISDTIGRTPVIKINNLAPEGINLYVKMESFNPLSSVKDRLALGVIDAAEKSGELKPGQTIVEATSGNTGIGLAMICAERGYPLVVTMAESFSVERRKLMRFLGAKVVLTPAAERGTGMVRKAAELAKKHGWWQSQQFENPANAEIHRSTTAVEIMEDFKDLGLDYWVTGFGTGGTVNGVASVLREKSPDTKIIICEPAAAPMLSSGNKQEVEEDGSYLSHPSFTPHPMQGWSPDFVSQLMQEAQAKYSLDDILTIEGPAALQASLQLAQKEGIFVGISSGATFAGALEVAKKAAPNANILCMLPDTGERYLSTPLFEQVDAEMNEEELEIAASV